MSQPAAGGTALLIVDMINDLDFEGGAELRYAFATIAENILKLREAADAAHVPIIYVNDNYGHWHSERSRIVDHCMREDSKAPEIVEAIKPRDDDFFVIKSQFSGFYASSLAVLLPKLRANRLILTGVAGDICILFTAADAHMRDYGLWVPEDCIASEDGQRNRWALQTMQNSMGAEICPTADLPLREWLGQGDETRDLLPMGRAETTTATSDDRQLAQA